MVVALFSRNGLRDWLVQRVTAIILAAYTLFLLSFFITQPHIDYTAWHNLHAHGWMRLLSVTCLLSLLWHAWIGIWTICTDYLKPLLVRLVVQILVMLALFIYFVWGVAVLWGINS